MRLQRMVALASELSRRAAEVAIEKGLVTVGGEVVRTLGTTVDPIRDRVCLRGKVLRIEGQRNYLAFNKPRGCIVTKSDPRNRPTIWEYLKGWREKLNSVGRLDFYSEGLLLLTDDGDFLNRLTHPRHEVWKVYHVRVQGIPSTSTMKMLREGVMLSDGKTLPAKVQRIDKGDPNALMEIGIKEGRNRQVRRMFDSVGHAVTRLKRVAIGPVKLGRLRPGQWRRLSADEVDSLRGHQCGSSYHTV